MFGQYRVNDGYVLYLVYPSPKTEVDVKDHHAAQSV